MRVEVYYNILKGCLSVKWHGRVIGHVEAVTLRNATFHVSEAGRQRVLRTKRKNVHAVVRGELVKYWAPTELVSDRVRYNPYNNATFVMDDGSPIHRAFELSINGNFMQAIPDRPAGWPAEADLEVLTDAA